MDTVCVMLSTYNGEKYINEQIDSIMNQRDVKIYLLIRDDGSKDKTVDILQQYNSKYPHEIKLIKGRNIGWMGSFHELTYYAFTDKKINFFAYADQDDVWMPDKLISGINRLKQYKNEPALYYADRMVVDENKNPLYRIGQREFVVKRGIKKKVLPPCQPFVSGCTQIFNRRLLEISTYAEKDFLINNKIPHDQWIAMTAVYFGKIEYNNKICILHRQHKDSITNSGKKRKRSLTFNYAPCAKVFADTYLKSGLLKKDDFRFLSMITDYRTNYIHKIRLLLDPDLRYESLLGCIKFKLAILFSRGL